MTRRWGPRRRTRGRTWGLLSGGPIIAIAVLCFGLSPSPALAQNRPSSPAGQGPMTVERVKSGFVFAPDVKVTEFDRRMSELVGGYAGWLTDRTFFIGGGGYWMPNRNRDRQLAYGGLVVGVQARADRRVGFGVKGLVGGGRATVVSSFSPFGDDDDRIHVLSGVGTQIVLPPIVTSARVRESFFVAEPEANVIIGLTKRFRLTAGAGYRFVGTRERGRRSDLDGATGSVALQIGGGG